MFVCKFALFDGSNEYQFTLTNTREITLGSTTYNFTLSNLIVNKEMYAPGHIQAQMQVANAECSVDKIRVDVFDKLLGMKAKFNDGTRTLAENYIVFDVQPVFTQNASLYLYLEIYSPEKLLSFKKFNDCHVMERLGEDIFKGIGKLYAKELGKTVTNLQHLKLASNEEFIQPYLVQYDETELDFLTRVANRCGEFMYYEGGAWHLGLDTTREATKFEGSYTSLTFNRYKKRDMAKYWANNYTEKAKKEKAGKVDEPKDANDPRKSDDTAKAAAAWKEHYEKVEGLENKKATNRYMYEKNYISEDDYKNNNNAIREQKMWQTYMGPANENTATYEKDDTSLLSTLGEKFLDVSYWLEAITDSLEKLTVSDIFGALFGKVGKDAVVAAIKYALSGNSFNEKNVTPYEPFALFLNSNKDEVAPLTNHEAVSLMTDIFYTGIKTCEEEAERQSVSVDLGNNYESLLLGDIITLMGQNYIVTNVSIVVTREGDTAKKHTIQTFEAIPFVEDKEKLKAFPAPIKGSTCRKAEPQTAIVTSTSDPFNLGRIQVRYPWQVAPEAKETADKAHKLSVPTSPWIRVSSPYASEEAAFKFAPEKGDEIMVGYEYGDVERPYMMGSLQSKDRPGQNEENYIIQTPNGHHIQFSNPKNFASFATNAMAPGLGALMGYIPPMKSAFDKMVGSRGKKLAGGITMGDAYGFYEIKMSTDKRQISISSALGDVEINAFTGITINAPNGDVSIKGKNVQIEAGNELKLLSGTNFKNEPFTEDAPWFKSFGSFSYNLGNQVAKFAAKPVWKEAVKCTHVVDVTLLRSVVECFLKPVGGTMQIKSQTFLKLEAGGEDADLPMISYTSNQELYSDEILKKVKQLKVKDTIDTVVRIIDDVVPSVQSFYQQLWEYRQTYNKKLQELWDLMKPEPSTLSHGKISFSGSEVLKEGEMPEFYKKYGIELADDVIKDVLAGKITDKTKAHENLDKLDYKTIDIADPQATEQEVPEYVAKKTEACTTLENIFTFIFDNKGVFLPDEKKKEDYYKNFVRVSEPKFIREVGILVDYRQEIGDCIKDAKVMEEIRDNLPKVEEFTKTCVDIIGADADSIIPGFTIFKRTLLHKVLWQLQKGHCLTIKNDGGALNCLDSIVSGTVKNRKLIKVDDEKACCKDSQSWSEFLLCVKEYDEDEEKWDKKSGGQKFLQGLANVGKNIIDFEAIKEFKQLGELHTRNPQVKGEILLTDPQGNTCNLKAGAIEYFPSNPFKKAKGVLKKI